MEQCTPCSQRGRVLAWKRQNPERKRDLNRKWAAANPDKDRVSKSDWQRRNPAVCAAKAANWRSANPERAKQINARYRDANRERLRNSWRFRHFRTRAPAWADTGAIAAFYQMARRATRCVGIRFEVDHVIPVRGRSVSGLHVPENLRVLPKYANASKGNRVVI